MPLLRSPWSRRPAPISRRSISKAKVAAPRYADALQVMEVVEPQAPLRREPRPDTLLDTEALKGERVTIYDINDEGWAWGSPFRPIRYVGWLPDEHALVTAERGGDPCAAAAL